MTHAPPKYRSAVGLRDTDKDEAPSVSVQGSQVMADEIVRVARRFGIPVVEEPGLAQALNELELDQKIPPALFRPVAVIIARLRALLKPKG